MLTFDAVRGWVDAAEAFTQSERAVYLMIGLTTLVAGTVTRKLIWPAVKEISLALIALARKVMAVTIHAEPDPLLQTLKESLADPEAHYESSKERGELLAGSTLTRVGLDASGGVLCILTLSNNEKDIWPELSATEQESMRDLVRECIARTKERDRQARRLQAVKPINRRMNEMPVKNGHA